MFKNQYDTDVSTWSPQGRLYQVEYAMEAVKQGSVTVGIKSNTHAVLASLKRTPHADFASYQSKCFTIAHHCGVSIAGLISDARVLARFMRTECMNYEYMYGSTLPLAQLADLVGDKCQQCTLTSSKRPFGVGMLIAGADQSNSIGLNGVHLYQTCPSGHIYDSKAAAIGARSQSARTYLERHYESFEKLSKDELIVHSLKALAATCGDGIQLNPRNTSISIVGISESEPFVILEEEEAAVWISKVEILPEDRVPDLPEEPQHSDLALETADFQDDI